MVWPAKIVSSFRLGKVVVGLQFLEQAAVFFLVNVDGLAVFDQIRSQGRAKNSGRGEGGQKQKEEKWQAGGYTLLPVLPEFVVQENRFIASFPG